MNNIFHFSKKYIIINNNNDENENEKLIHNYGKTQII